MQRLSSLHWCAVVLLTGSLSLSVAAQQAPAPQAPAPQAPAPPPAPTGPPGPPAGRAGGPPAPPQPPPPSPAAMERAGQILAEAHKAMGGDKLKGITSVLVTGQTRRVRGDNLVPIEFEIAIELPDKYVRKDEVPAEESEPTSTGFIGTEVIQFPAPPAGRAGGPPAPAAPPAGAPGAPGAPPAAGRPGGPPPAPSPAQLEAQRTARLNTAKQEFARLALGLFADSLATFPMTFAYAAQAQAPQGTADVLDVRGPANFTAKLFIASDTHLPILLSWQAPPTGVVVTTPGQPAPRTIAPGAVIIAAPSAPAATATAEDKDNYTKQVAAMRQKALATPVEYRLYYADYRDVDGVKFPFRLRRAIGPDTTEETTFDRFRLNTKIDPRKFALGR
jgi:hypothetical protein